MPRRVSVAGLVAAGCAGVLWLVALVAVPVAGADEGTTPGTGTGPSTTPLDPAPPPAPADTTAPVARTVPQPRLIAAGVRIGGTLVGGLTAAEAREVVTRRFTRPLRLVVSPTRRVRATPRQLGATAYIRDAISLAARVKRPGFVVPLKVDVQVPRLERYLRRLGRETYREPRSARLLLHGAGPLATPAVPGRRLKEVVSGRAVRLALKTHDREPLPLRFDEIRPLVTEKDFGQVIVIRREAKQLYYFEQLKLKRVFRVATGQASYPTPLGRFQIVTKQRHPWWYPPQTSSWAQGLQPVPPGPGNPLGTRWMGISSPYVGIHGTPDAASIGYSASHGCVRMLIPQVEWIFERVQVGTPVFIVPT